MSTGTTLRRRACRAKDEPVKNAKSGRGQKHYRDPYARFFEKMQKVASAKGMTLIDYLNSVYVK